MDRIAHEYLKIDLHIHSIFSKDKEPEGSEVYNNTLENINVLIEKLTENEVNLAAITDHNVFNYNLYTTFKELCTKTKTIKKVLPGVEFDIEHKKYIKNN